MADYQRLYEQFLKGSDVLRVHEDGHCIFASAKPMLVPLLEYIEVYAPHHKKVVVFDKIMGNAAALLCVKANSSEVYSPLGSELAVKTLNRYGITYHITKLVPAIQKPGMSEICPMEKLSIDREPEEFYQTVTLKKSKAAC